LAKLAKLQPGYLHEIENGVKRGSIDTYRALATALAVTIDDLI
jgi:transcriptional regulator with XRE-family HTH domain